MKISEHANNLLNEFGKLQFDFAITLNNSLVPERDTARDNLASYIAELEWENKKFRQLIQCWIDIFDPQFLKRYSFIDDIRLAMIEAIKERDE